MLRGGKTAKIKDIKHDDRMDTFTFAHFLFGEPIGHVDAIKISEEGVTAEDTMKKHTPPNFTCYDAMHKQEQKRRTPSWWDIKKGQNLFDIFDYIENPPSPIVINTEELKEIQCSVCKAKMQPNAELHYVAISSKRTNPFYTSEEALYDAYDCPLCGSQIILGQRLEKLK